jgi:hypothetical protein
MASITILIAKILPQVAQLKTQLKFSKQMVTFERTQRATTHINREAFRLSRKLDV